MNNAINSVTAKYGVSSTDATKVVPVISVGDGSRAGAAQVSGPQSKVDQVKAALMHIAETEQLDPEKKMIEWEERK